MNLAEILEKIAEKDFDLDAFVHLVLADVNARRIIVEQMIKNENIMIYYHCFYVVSKASRISPELFYTFWPEIAMLLHHHNSYHRNFALEILANLAGVDMEDRFSSLADDYLALLNDEKFMTGNCCLQNLQNIYVYKPKFRNRITALLLDIDSQCDYTQKQKALLKYDVLHILDAVYEDIKDKEDVHTFIKAQANSISPKTRKKAQALIGKYGLSA